MGKRSLLVLLLLVAGLGAVLWLTDEKRPVQKVAETKVLGGRSLMEAKAIHWQFHNRTPIELARGPEGLRIVEPIDDVVSAAYLRNIIAAWDSAQMQAAPLADTAENREKNGLSPPEVVVGVEWDDGTKIEVEIGGVGPLSDRDTRFLRMHDKLWVGSVALFESLRVGLDDLREHVVFRHMAVEVDELQVEQRLSSGTRERVQLKKGEGGWRLLSPVDARADQDASKQYISGVLGLRVNEFVPGVVQVPQGEPTIVIDVSGQRGKETLRLWVEQGQLFGLLPGRNVWFTADNNQYTQIFANDAERLRARILLPMREGAFEELVELVVDPGDGRGDRMRLSRPASVVQWRLVEPVEMPASMTACNEAALALQTLHVAEFVDEAGTVRPRANDPRYGLNAKDGRLAVTVKVANDPKAVTLWFGKPVTRPEHPLVYACRADDPDSIVLVGQGFADTLTRSWLVYCEPRVLDLGSIHAERLELHQDGRDRVYKSDGKTWVQEGVEGARPEVGELANEHLRDLRGTKAVDVRGPQFAKPTFTIDLMRGNTDKLATLRVWDRGPDAPLLFQGNGPAGVAFEVKELISRAVRALWQ